MGVQAVPMGIYGPLPKNTVGLILGRSSTFLKNLQIHPRVTDQDYTGALKILAQAPQNFVAIAPTDKIAQLVIFPSVKAGKVPTATPWGEKGFGHSSHTYGYSESLLITPRWFLFEMAKLYGIVRYRGRCFCNCGATLAVQVALYSGHWRLKGCRLYHSSLTECLPRLLAQ
jgi:hypothetical protein